MRSVLTIILVCGPILLASCAITVQEPAIEKQQDGAYRTFMIDETEWSGQILTNRLIKKAEFFCVKHNQIFEKVLITSKDDGRFNHATSEVIFKCTSTK